MGRFIERMIRIFAEDDQMITLTEGETLPNLQIKPHPRQANETAISGQNTAIDAIVHVVNGQRRRPVVLTADRGRGKSAALGLAAAQLIHQGVKRILLTAADLKSVDAVFQHAASALTGSKLTKTTLNFNDASLQFLPPDSLLTSTETADLVLVDEAATIPPAMLKALLLKYSRIVFATTLHGYEGTGQGFRLRFQATLDKHTRGWKAITLEEPIRWSANDPLEQLTNRILWQATEPAMVGPSLKASNEQQTITVISQDTLLSNEQLLSDIYSLLVLAHYKTRPFDLRQLLDAPDLGIYITTENKTVIAVALVSYEGGFETEMAKQITQGERRPQGHLLAETLAAQCGFTAAAELKSARIIRIAVHPDYQNKGTGSRLLQAIITRESEKHIDYLGVSFGATPALLRFWQRAGFHAARLGIKRGKASGEHSITMIIGISKTGVTLATQLQQQFSVQFLHQITDNFKMLDTELLALLLTDMNTETANKLTPLDQQDIKLFAHAKRTYATVSGSLNRLILQAFSQLSVNEMLTVNEQTILLVCVVQQRDQDDVVTMVGLSGRGEMIEKLRVGCWKLYDFH